VNYGIKIATSGVLNSMYRQDVLSGNLANLNTAGYKPVLPDSRVRDVARVEDQLPFMDSNALLERLGAGVTNAPNRISLAQGPIETTGNPLDLAIQGDGFLTVESGTDSPHLTRDGRLALNARGELVLAASGDQILDTQGRPVRLDATRPVRIDADGTVVQDERAVARLGLVEPLNASNLRKLGAGLFEVAGGAQALRPGSGSLLAGAIEGSSVNEIKALMDIESASRAVSSNIGLIGYQDRMMDLAINRFGRVA